MKIFCYHYAYIIEYFHVNVNRIMKLFMRKEGENLIYERIRKLCKEKGISIYRLEKDLGFSSCSICKWKSSGPSVDKIQKVADYFQVSVDYLLEGDGGSETCDCGMH